MPTAKRRPKPAAAAKKPTVASRIDRRDRRRERSREEILDAARVVLKRQGIAATTLEAVADEVGVSKPALYYYFPSKNALLFELIFGVLDRHAHIVQSAVAQASSGGDALRTIIREGMDLYAPRLDDFRLAFLHGQVAERGAVHLDEEQFARIRPLNELWFAGAAKRLGDEQRKRPSRAKVEPRLMAFLAYLATIGVLTMKGMVDSLEDPLAYSDEELAEGMARIFEAAAGP